MSSEKIHPAHALLSRAHSPGTAQALFTDRIKNKPLILRPTSPPPSNNRQRRRLERLKKREYFLRKQKPRPLSAKEKRVTGVHDLNRERGECRWEVYEGLNRLWTGYVWEVLGLRARAVNGDNVVGMKVVTAQSHGALLASLDYHGAEVEVVRCSCVGRIGTRGIVVRDTKFTLVVVTRKDEVRTIPKKDTIFRFEVSLPQDDVNKTSQEEQAKPPQKPLVFELHGNQFTMRAADRANKKFKWRSMEYV